MFYLYTFLKTLKNIIDHSLPYNHTFCQKKVRKKKERRLCEIEIILSNIRSFQAGANMKNCSFYKSLF